jgi:hypothetical protein
MSNRIPVVCGTFFFLIVGYIPPLACTNKKWTCILKFNNDISNNLHCIYSAYQFRLKIVIKVIIRIEYLSSIVHFFGNNSLKNVLKISGEEGTRLNFGWGFLAPGQELDPMKCTKFPERGSKTSKSKKVKMLGKWDRIILSLFIIYIHVPQISISTLIPINAYSIAHIIKYPICPYFICYRANTYQVYHHLIYNLNHPFNKYLYYHQNTSTVKKYPIISSSRSCMPKRLLNIF